MSVTLESLELNPQELQACREAVERMAYFNWLDAGCPCDGAVDFWLEAEREWIGHQYVPPRPLEAPRATTEAAHNRRTRTPEAHGRRRRARAKAR